MNYDYWWCRISVRRPAFQFCVEFCIFAFDSDSKRSNKGSCPTPKNRALTPLWWFGDRNHRVLCWSHLLCSKYWNDLERRRWGTSKWSGINLSETKFAKNIPRWSPMDIFAIKIFKKIQFMFWIHHNYILKNNTLITSA